MTVYNLVQIEKEEQEKAEDVAQTDTWGGQTVEPLQQTQPQVDQWPDTTQTTDVRILDSNIVLL